MREIRQLLNPTERGKVYYLALFILILVANRGIIFALQELTKLRATELDALSTNINGCTAMLENVPPALFIRKLIRGKKRID